MIEETSEKYINLFTDFGFKRIFGEDVNKDFLLDFLNELLKDQLGAITELQYLKTEQLGRSADERKAVFDIYCQNDKGEKFLVEMQKTKQAYFKDRTVYYATFPVQEQAKRSDWDYNLKSVYTVAILDFVFEEDKLDKSKFRYDIKLTDVVTKKVFYDKLTFIYFEMPKFTKQLSELETNFDRWLYVLKNMHKLDRLPDELHTELFERVFKVAEIAKFTQEEHRNYEDSLKSYRDMQNSIDTARAEGKEEGIALGENRMTALFVINSFKAHIPVETIALIANISVDEVRDILRSEGLL